MPMQVYQFDKSLQLRMMELVEILCNRCVKIPASRIKSEWSYHVELVIEPTGWQAVWKIPRTTCEEFKIHYPTFVVVEVEQVDFNELTALAKITAVQDEIHLPEKYDIPLIELHPTHNQKNGALDIVGTACCIDQLRFFYNQLWMPWDIDDDDSSDWASLHLEARIRLYYDINREGTAKETCGIIKGLVRESKEIREKILILEESMPEPQESDDEELIDDVKACQLLKLHLRMQHIKTEMEVLENPVIRKMFIKFQTAPTEETIKKKLIERAKQREGYFVWIGSDMKRFKDAVSRILLSVPDNFFIKSCGSLQEALQLSESGNVIFVGDGVHEIKGSDGLEDGGTIKGVENAEYTIIIPTEEETAPSVFDFSGDEVLLENISIDICDLQAGVIVRKGTMKMVGCKIYTSVQSSVKVGVAVLSGATLTLEKTEFEGLGTAVIIYPSGRVDIDECSFANCTEGVQLYDDSNLSLSKCRMEKFQDYAIRMETEKYCSKDENKMGDFTMLENIREIRLYQCAFSNNVKADVILKAKAVTNFTVTQDSSEVAES